MTRTLLAAILLAGTALPAWADDYTLFNPTPDDQLRSMSTERPSRSDSPFTIDPGHLQIETSLFAGSHDQDCRGGDCTTTRFLSGGNGTTVRLGLTEDAEIQAIFDAYDSVTVSDKATGTHDHHSGFGDTILRYKYNFWGNDGSGTALAIIPYVKIPTNADHLGNNDVEGGVTAPFNWTIDKQLSVGLQTGITLLHDDTGTGHEQAYNNSALVNYNFTDKLSSFVELYTYREESAPQWQNTADVGVVYALTDNITIDSAVNVGISRAAPDVAWLSGFSFRF